MTFRRVQEDFGLLLDNIIEPEPEPEPKGSSSVNGVSSHEHFAKQFVASSNGDWLYDDESKTWWHWNGKEWREQTHRARHLMMDVIHKATADDADDARAFRRNNHVSGALTVASDHPKMAVKVSEGFNTDPMLAGLPGHKVLNLETGEVRAATRDDRITMSLAVAPEDGDPDELLTFLQFAFDEFGDQRDDLIHALLWWCGDAMRGHVCKSDSHGFIYFWGDSGTGKSTICNILYRVMGDYATSVNATRITGKREDHLQWLMRLRGKRLVVAAELRQQPLKCEIVNALSAGDPIEANAMRKDSVDFRSVAHLLMNGNHKPSINSPGTFRRMRLVEMNRKPDVEDEDMEDRIVETEGGKFVQLALKTRRESARPQWPARVKAAVKEYELENDLVGMWITENCTPKMGHDMPSKDGYEDFKRWCESNGYRAPTKTYLSRVMKKKGHPCEQQRVDGVKDSVYRNIAVDSPTVSTATIPSTTDWTPF